MSNARTTRAPAVNLGYCNPYGAETGGPQRVLGGLHGPASAATPGMGLPPAVAQGEWACANRAQIRCRMICACGHTGQVMALCSWHDETNYRGEMVAGTLRQVSETLRVRGHFEEIQRRQSDTCPRCILPSGDGYDYAALYREHREWGNELGMLQAAGMWRSPRAAMIRQRLEDIGKEMDQGIALGRIHKCPLTLTPIS